MFVELVGVMQFLLIERKGSFFIEFPHIISLVLYLMRKRLNYSLISHLIINYKQNQQATIVKNNHHKSLDV
jgi:hypothetical protein